MILRLIALLLAFLPALPLAGAEKTRPNFVVILTDDQGYGDLGYSTISKATSARRPTSPPQIPKSSPASANSPTRRAWI